MASGSRLPTSRRSASGKIDARQVELLVERFSQEAKVKPQVVHEVILAHALDNRWRIVDQGVGRR